jgi:hypothetical protein
MFGDLMAGAKGATEKQLRDIALYEAKKKEKGLTEKQQKDLDTWISKRDNVELSKGAKTILRKLRREAKFGREREIHSKYLTKGIEFEEEAITWLSIFHDTEFTNNTERRTDDYFSGECDIPEGFDTKVAWMLNTLPDPAEPLKIIYEFQNRIYMRLWKKKKWTTSAIVMSMLPRHIDNELHAETWKWKDGDVPMWRKIEIVKYYVYDQEFFDNYLKKNDCLPNLKKYETLLKEGKEVDPMLEKACDMYMKFVEVPMHEMIVEKTVEWDEEINDKMEDIAILARGYMQEIEDEMYEKFLSLQE